MKKTMLKFFFVIALFAFTATSCGKSKVDCKSIKTAEKITELLNNLIEDPSVENCNAYVDYVITVFESCASNYPGLEEVIEEYDGTCVD